MAWPGVPTQNAAIHGGTHTPQPGVHAPKLRSPGSKRAGDVHVVLAPLAAQTKPPLRNQSPRWITWPPGPQPSVSLSSSFCFWQNRDARGPLPRARTRPTRATEAYARYGLGSLESPRATPASRAVPSPRRVHAPRGPSRARALAALPRFASGYARSLGWPPVRSSARYVAPRGRFSAGAPPPLCLRRAPAPGPACVSSRRPPPAVLLAGLRCAHPCG
jgi:hypothetical protein